MLTEQQIKQHNSAFVKRIFDHFVTEKDELVIPSNVFNKAVADGLISVYTDENLRNFEADLIKGMKSGSLFDDDIAQAKKELSVLVKATVVDDKGKKTSVSISKKDKPKPANTSIDDEVKAKLDSMDEEGLRGLHGKLKMSVHNHTKGDLKYHPNAEVNSVRDSKRLSELMGYMSQRGVEIEPKETGVSSKNDWDDVLNDDGNGKKPSDGKDAENAKVVSSQLKKELTRSGKAIMNRDAADYKNYDADDHFDAMTHHKKIAAKHESGDKKRSQKHYDIALSHENAYKEAKGSKKDGGTVKELKQEDGKKTVAQIKKAREVEFEKANTATVGKSITDIFEKALSK